MIPVLYTTTSTPPEGACMTSDEHREPLLATAAGPWQHVYTASKISVFYVLLSILLFSDTAAAW